MKIIITAGPTNERIDSVMKITNMSTGALGSTIAETLLADCYYRIERLFYISTKMSRKPRIASDKITYVQVESTDDLIAAISDIGKRHKIDAVIHSAAVGDYAGKYSIRAEDLIDEILDIPAEQLTRENLLKVFENPRAVADNSGKMSSYEPHLMTMFRLTPKVIGLIHQLCPGTKLIGFKLLDGVSKEELLHVASKLREKNNADYIIANDLSKIGNGKHWAMIVGEDGIVTECESKREIALAIESLIF